MKRKLIKQIRHEWRSNLWMSIELLIISVIVWFVTDYLYAIYQTINEPKGYDIENTYIMEFGTYPQDSPKYVELGEDAKTRNAEDRLAIVEAIRRRPDVEAVSISQNMEPGFQNYWGFTVPVNDNDSVQLSVRMGMMTPDHIKTIGIKAKDPKITQDQLVQMVRAGKVLISDFYENSNSLPYPMTPESLVGQRVTLQGQTYEVGAIIEYIKRIDTEQYKRDIVMVVPLNENNPAITYQARYVSIRVKPGDAKRFIARFNQDREKQYTRNNTYVKSIKSYDEVYENATHDMNVTKRKYIGCMAFMLVSVFLGLLGTFWLRTRQRVPEIAVRKINGASNTSIALRLASEGIFLLTIVTPLAIVCDWLICHYELNQNIRREFFVPSRFAITVVLTYVMLVVTILIGIAFPAWKAMQVQPAEALKDE